MCFVVISTRPKAIKQGLGFRFLEGVIICVLVHSSGGMATKVSSLDESTNSLANATREVIIEIREITM